MVEVRLHGPLAQFGKVWNLEIETPAEAIRLIRVNTKGFLRKIKELSDQGMVFRLRTNTHDLSEDELECKTSKMTRLDIIPVVAGANAGLRFIVGAVLVAVGVIYQQPWAISMGASLMLGSVVEWLTPVPSQKDYNSPEGKQSWTISGPGNTVEQGYPVPVIYGTVLTGGYVVSAGMSVAEATDGTLVPSVSLGGRLSDAINGGWRSFEEAMTFYYTFNVTARVANLSSPLSYTWSHTGFANAVSVAATPIKGGYQVKVGYHGVASGVKQTITGSVHVVASGKSAADGSIVEVEADADLSLVINHPVALG